MDEAMSEFLEGSEKESRERLEGVERLVTAADASKVFGTPVVSGDRTIITAAHVAGGGGFGSGMGFGSAESGRSPFSGQPGNAAKPGGDGVGRGGGGGGRSVGRPVAAIVISPDGVQVRPIFDTTKIALTALAAAAVLTALSMKRLRRH